MVRGPGNWGLAAAGRVARGHRTPASTLRISHVGMCLGIYIRVVPVARVLRATSQWWRCGLWRWWRFGGFEPHAAASGRGKARLSGGGGFGPVWRATLSVHCFGCLLTLGSLSRRGVPNRQLPPSYWRELVHGLGLVD